MVPFFPFLLGGNGMTIQKVLSTVDELKPNSISEGQKLEWLNEIETTVYTEVILTHQGSDQYEKPHIDLNTDYNTELIAQEPYDRIYPEYVMCKIDFTEREWDGYNNTAAQFSQSYKEYKAWYNRNHLPKSSVKWKNFL